MQSNECDVLSMEENVIIRAYFQSLSEQTNPDVVGSSLHIAFNRTTSK